VHLIHPGQVLSPFEPEQFLEPATMAANALWVVADMEREIPAAVDPVLVTVVGGAPGRGIGVAPAGNETGPRAASGEVPAGPRAQIRLDQVCDLNGSHFTHP
jgi:hypothetical protein